MAPSASDSALAVAADSTVVPHTPASATRTDSSGSQRSRQVSRNVPVAPREAAGEVERPVRFRVEGVALEDDEPCVDAAPP